MKSPYRTGAGRFAAAARAALLVSLMVTAAACDEGPSTPTSSSATGSSTTPGGSSPTSTARVSATRYLAFGDSLTAGEITAPQSSSGGFAPFTVVSGASYPSKLQDRLRERYQAQGAEITVTNAGRPGELAVNAQARLAQLLANSQTQALLLLDGYNDLLDFGAGGVSPASSAMNLLAREGRLRGARVFIGLMPPPIAGRQRSVDDAVVRAYNDQLRTIAAGEGAVVVDLYRALATDVARYIGVDGHHPNEAGYQRIAEEFMAQIAAELEPR